MNLKNKIALVTGGSSGMGEAIAKKLDESECRVIITYQKNENGAEDVLSSFQNEGAKFKLDLRKDTDILELFAFIKDKFGKLDILVNNAGANRPRELMAMSTWREIFQINLFGLVMCTDEAVKLMSEGGKILNISSIYGDGPACWKGLTAYGAAKASVNHFTQTMAKNLAPKILINALAPGYVKTPLWKDTTEEEFVKSGEEQLIERMILPDEIAQMAIAIIENDAMTGSIVRVDGGVSLKTV